VYVRQPALLSLEGETAAPLVRGVPLPIVVSEWLSIRGKQPNMSESSASSSSSATDAARDRAPAPTPDADDSGGKLVQTLEPQSAAVLTPEQQQFLDIVALSMIYPDSPTWRASFRSISKIRGISILVPHLVRFAASAVAKFVHVSSHAQAASELLFAVASNPSASSLSLYMHHVLPAATSVILSGGGLGPDDKAKDVALDAVKKSAEDAVSARAWGVRLLHRLCASFADEHPSLLPRVVATLSTALDLERDSSGTDRLVDVAGAFGALSALDTLGPAVREVALVRDGESTLPKLKTVTQAVLAEAATSSSPKAAWDLVFATQLFALLDKLLDRAGSS
jgi:hypothetical protein